MGRKSNFIVPTEAEDAEINRGIAQDPDNPEWTDADFAEARPIAAVAPSMEGVRRVRGPQKAPVKTLVSIRLDPDVVDRLKQQGRGWQGRANDILRHAVGLD
ncbi:BrnA antitoxin family protein [Gluconacetobacter sp. 1b LMG 1731]|uniref:BrnA antitoxin family protein n=1 Tax=Gluconacetobacter dulcium TaxID=2729096 RepID=A0A7W4JWF5_9PROT|nr:BrnA antitoxin family protein [Gluconacetobacter dulcium]MBB2165575.1 BrnA antitoxin family protein [Gluconacetobacter dulcium]MBB2194711.1 BrnA antitoxin family protein [Gluconacetobacter dulcium]MBB2196011.1 BrnA antitoxin family protein [Gluconacetobacter dulcium]